VSDTIVLEQHQPNYWAASTGEPAGVEPWTALDPGTPKGRPAMDGSADRVLRGFLCAWAVDPETGEEIRWDELSGSATIVNYDKFTAWQYLPHAWRVANPDIEPGEPTGTPGVLNLDGVEFDTTFSMIEFGFFGAGDWGLSDIAFDGDLTILPISLDVSGSMTNHFRTKGHFEVWNENAVKFTGMYRCVEGWDQTLFSAYDVPNIFLRSNLMTDTGKVHLDGIPSLMCEGSDYAPLIGVVNKLMSFQYDDAFDATGKLPVGSGSEAGVLTYDPREYCWARSVYCQEYISVVQVGSIINASGCHQYSKYTHLSTEMEIGVSYDMTVSIGDPFSNDLGGIWIDWNQDLDFDDPGETIPVEGSPGMGPFTATIIPPEDALPGDTRMRVRLLWGAEILPCGSTNYGEVEDYTITVVAPDYCAASGGCFEHISGVVVGDIDNNSECSEYADYTSISTDMPIGVDHEITVINGNPYAGDQCGIWVDWNQDLDFDDPDEMIAVSGTPGLGPYTATITPPPGALLGDTRMRIRITWTGAVDPCGDTSYGEVEDYTITVVAAPSYCEAEGGCSEHIARIEIGDIDHASACDGYADYTAYATSVARGSTYPLTVTVGDAYNEEDQGGVWVDWNHDFDFDDPGETIPVEGSPGVGPYIAQIVPPASALLGSTRMRVRVTWTGSVLPCGLTTFGEVEDYTLIVVEGQAEPADINGDGVVDVQDLLALLAEWGGTSGPADINGDGIVDVQDLLALLAAWTSA
jgi:hypothetical protein